MKRDHDKRNTVQCKRCNKVKLNFGLGMCSACLRRTKRETRPSFYLGTCYSEMSRRVKTFDPLRPQYYGKKICKREDFIAKFINDFVFLKLYKKWQKNEFKRKFAPSIDRIDNNKGYVLTNLRFTTHFINSTKDLKIKIELKSNTETLVFESCQKAAAFLGITPSTFCVRRKKDGPYKGFIINELK